MAATVNTVSTSSAQTASAVPAVSQNLQTLIKKVKNLIIQYFGKDHEYTEAQYNLFNELKAASEGQDVVDVVDKFKMLIKDKETPFNEQQYWKYIATFYALEEKTATS